MEVRTGEILALVNLGRTPGGGYAERENYAIGRNTEPGSTFKLASMLLLLDDADMPLDQTYDTGNGRVVKVGGIRVQDSHAGFNDMDFRTAVPSRRTSISPRRSGSVMPTTRSVTATS